MIRGPEILFREGAVEPGSGYTLITLSGEIPFNLERNGVVTMNDVQYLTMNRLIRAILGHSESIWCCIKYRGKRLNHYRQRCIAANPRLYKPVKSLKCKRNMNLHKTNGNGIVTGDYTVEVLEKLKDAQKKRKVKADEKKRKVEKFMRMLSEAAARA